MVIAYNFVHKFSINGMTLSAYVRIQQRVADFAGDEVMSLAHITCHDRLCCGWQRCCCFRISFNWVCIYSLLFIVHQGGFGIAAAQTTACAMEYIVKVGYAVKKKISARALSWRYLVQVLVFASPINCVHSINYWFTCSG